MPSLPSPPAGRRKRPYVRFSARLGRAICARVAAGETVAAICREEGMPSQHTVLKWRHHLPAFAKALSRARLAAERRSLSGPVSTYSPEVALSFYERVCEGEGVVAICRDPDMPSFSAFYRWRKHVPEFARMMAEARDIQAERFCDLGWEIAEAVTPQTAYATHVKLGQLRWTAGMLAPHKYGRTKPVELDAEGTGGDYVVIIQRFTDAPLEDGTVLAPGERREIRRTPLHRLRSGDWDDEDQAG